jgi:hypothetical protein
LTFTSGSRRTRHRTQAPHGIQSLTALNDLAVPEFSTDGAVTYGPGGAGAVPPAVQFMRSGDLQPFHRPPIALDFVAQNRDMTRISSLASQRSDVFTVYVTVQLGRGRGPTS